MQTLNEESPTSTFRGWTIYPQPSGPSPGLRSQPPTRSSTSSMDLPWQTGVLPSAAPTSTNSQRSADASTACSSSSTSATDSTTTNARNLRRTSQENSRSTESTSPF